MIDVLKKFNPKRVPSDTIAAAEARLDEQKARRDATQARRDDTARRLAETRERLEAAAESGEPLAPIAKAALDLEAEVKALDLEAGPLAGVVARAEAALADLKEERRLALIDAELEDVHAEFEKAKAEAAEEVRILAEKIERAYGFDRLRSVLLRERNGKHDVGSKMLTEDGTWRIFLEEESKARPFSFELAPEDVGKTVGSWSLRLELYLRVPEAVMRSLRASRRAA